MNKKIKLEYVGVFFITLVLHLLLLCQKTTISIISDYIGDLAAPVTLAGLDWKSLISEVKYYGYGFKWIYFIFFKMTDNPYIIYLCIRIFMKVLIALTSVLIYHVQIKYLGMKRNSLPMFFAVFVSMQAGTSFNSEGSIFIACWITVFLIVKYINDDGKRIKHAIILAIWLAYTITLHERMVALVLAVCALIIWFKVLYNKWIVAPKVYFVSQIFFYVLIEKITDLYCNYFWRKTNVANTTIIPKNKFWIFDGIWNFKIFVDGIISNIITLNIKTYGVMFIGMAILIASTVILLNKKMVKERVEKERRVEESLCAIIWLFGICIIATICGLSLRWGYKISIDDMANYKGFTYHRYYLVYAWPAFMATIIYVFRFGLNKVDKIISVALFVIFNAYFILEIFPKLSNVSKEVPIFFERILITDFVRNNNVEVNLWICLLITLIVLLSFVICKKTKKTYVILGALSIISLSSLTNHFSITKPNVSFDSYENVYKVIKQVEKYDDIGTRIFTDYSPYTLQFMLNRYSVEYKYPTSEDENTIFITPCNFDVMRKYLPQYQEYQVVQVEDEYIYIKGERLIHIFEDCGYKTQKYVAE